MWQNASIHTHVYLHMQIAATSKTHVTVAQLFANMIHKKNAT